jgi:hypothetical protein
MKSVPRSEFDQGLSKACRPAVLSHLFVHLSAGRVAEDGRGPDEGRECRQSVTVGFAKLLYPVAETAHVIPFILCPFGTYGSGIECK